MANPEHLAVLKQGVEAWNRWRAENRSAVPDLEGADLQEKPLNLIDFDSTNLAGADLTRAELMFASLRSAKLNKARLTSAFLTGTCFRGADLSNCIMKNAGLIDTDLRQADLTEANLGGSQLLRVDFTWAQLTRTSFGKAMLSWGVFGGTDLASAIGLESVFHVGPSTIGVDTLSLSKGRIPETFLRGAGVPDRFIIVDKQPPDESFYSCFISYSTNDQGFADKLHADLRNKGVSCWSASQDLKIGDRFRQSIDEAIRHHEKFLVVLSSSSISSLWVEDEVESAIERENREGRLVLLPIRLDSAVMDSDKAWAAKIRRTRHIGDFSNMKDLASYQQAFQRLLRDLRADH